MAKLPVLVWSGHGLNCEEETAFAFEKAGERLGVAVQADIVHVQDIIDDTSKLSKYAIQVFPGGFSMGDYTGSGKLYANLIKQNLPDELRDFVSRDTLSLLICNGFQIGSLLGITPNTSGSYAPEVALTRNANPRYHTRWVELKVDALHCVFTQGLGSLKIPIAHGEGKVHLSAENLAALQANQQIALRYAKNGQPAKGEFPYNPNGSLDDIAGICDGSGRVLGLMPHPERAISFTHLPNWPKLAQEYRRMNQALPQHGPGMALFENAVRYFR